MSIETPKLTSVCVYFFLFFYLTHTYVCAIKNIKYMCVWVCACKCHAYLLILRSSVDETSSKLEKNFKQECLHYN